MRKGLVEELQGVVRGEVTGDPRALEAYSTDASIFRVRPEAAVSPKNAEDLMALVRWASAARRGGRRVSLTARAGGSDMTGGPLNDSVIVDFTKHFNRIKSIEDARAVVEPGVFYRDLEPELKRRGLLLPSYPASKSLCTLGGMAANNSGGEKTLAYGKTEKYVEALKVVLADGKEYSFRPLTKAELQKKLKLKTSEGAIYRKLYTLLEKHYALLQAARPNVSKNSAGYALWNVWDRKSFDMTKLFVGSQGTLGLFSEITFRLVRQKKHSRLAVVFLRDLKPLAELAAKALTFKPESFESYDDHTLKVALQFLPGLLKSLGGNIFSLAWQFLPEFLMVLRGGLPKLVLLIELTSDDERELEERLHALQGALKSFNVTVWLTRTEREAEKYWTIRRESFNLLRHRIRDRQTVPFIDDLIVRPERLSEFLPRLNALLEPYEDKLIYTIAGHVGDGNFHIIPLMNLRDPESKKVIAELSEKVYPLVMEFNGSITAEHNDGLIRSPYLKLMYGEKICRLFAEVKKMFDPLGILNPHKKVGADFGYALEHIK